MSRLEFKVKGHQRSKHVTPYERPKGVVEKVKKWLSPATWTGYFNKSNNYAEEIKPRPHLGQLCSDSLPNIPLTSLSGSTRLTEAASVDKSVYASSTFSRLSSLSGMESNPTTLPSTSICKETHSSYSVRREVDASLISSDESWVSEDLGEEERIDSVLPSRPTFISLTKNEDDEDLTSSCSGGESPLYTYNLGEGTADVVQHSSLLLTPGAEAPVERITNPLFAFQLPQLTLSGQSCTSLPELTRQVCVAQPEVKLSGKIHNSPLNLNLLGQAQAGHTVVTSTYMVTMTRPLMSSTIAREVRLPRSCFSDQVHSPVKERLEEEVQGSVAQCLPITPYGNRSHAGVVVSNSSILSPSFLTKSSNDTNESIRPSPFHSPFYSGRTAYGGAASGQRLRLKRRHAETEPSVCVPVRARVRPSSTQDKSPSVLSITSKRILDSLQMYTSPLRDARRMPMRGISDQDLLPSKRRRISSSPPSSHIMTPPPVTPLRTLHAPYHSSKYSTHSLLSSDAEVTSSVPWFAGKGLSTPHVTTTSSTALPGFSVSFSGFSTASSLPMMYSFPPKPADILSGLKFTPVLATHELPVGADKEREDVRRDRDPVYQKDSRGGGGGKVRAKRRSQQHFSRRSQVEDEEDGNCFVNPMAPPPSVGLNLGTGKSIASIKFHAEHTTSTNVTTSPSSDLCLTSASFSFSAPTTINNPTPTKHLVSTSFGFSVPKSHMPSPLTTHSARGTHPLHAPSPSFLPYLSPSLLTGTPVSTSPEVSKLTTNTKPVHMRHVTSSGPALIKQRISNISTSPEVSKLTTNTKPVHMRHVTSSGPALIKQRISNISTSPEVSKLTTNTKPVHMRHVTSSGPALIKQRISNISSQKQPLPLKSGSVEDVFKNMNKLSGHGSLSTIPTQKESPKKNSVIYENGKTIIDKGLLSSTSAGSWICSNCHINNEAASLKCAMCQRSRLVLLPTKELTVASPQASSSETSPQASSSLAAKFAPACGSWECEVCMLSNKADSNACVACCTPKHSKTGASVPSSSADKFVPLSSSSVVVSNKSGVEKPVTCFTPKQGSDGGPHASKLAVCSGGLKMAMTVGECNTSTISTPSTGSLLQGASAPSGCWSCDTCMVSNKPECLSCIACTAPKPGTSAVNVATGISSSSGIQVGGSFSLAGSSVGQSSAGSVLSFGSSGGFKLSGGLSFGSGLKLGDGGLKVGGGTGGLSLGGSGIRIGGNGGDLGGGGSKFGSGSGGLALGGSGIRIGGNGGDWGSGGSKFSGGSGGLALGGSGIRIGGNGSVVKTSSDGGGGRGEMTMTPQSPQTITTSTKLSAETGVKHVPMPGLIGVLDTSTTQSITSAPCSGYNIGTSTPNIASSQGMGLGGTTSIMFGSVQTSSTTTVVSSNMLPMTSSFGQGSASVCGFGQLSAGSFPTTVPLAQGSGSFFKPPQNELQITTPPTFNFSAGKTNSLQVPTPPLSSSNIGMGGGIALGSHFVFSGTNPPVPSSSVAAAGSLLPSTGALSGSLFQGITTQQNTNPSAPFNFNIKASVPSSVCGPSNVNLFQFSGGSLSTSVASSTAGQLQSLNFAAVGVSTGAPQQTMSSLQFGTAGGSFGEGGLKIGFGGTGATSLLGGSVGGPTSQNVFGGIGNRSLSAVPFNFQASSNQSAMFTPTTTSSIQQGLPLTFGTPPPSSFNFSGSGLGGKISNPAAPHPQHQLFQHEQQSVGVGLMGASNPNSSSTAGAGTNTGFNFSSAGMNLNFGSSIGQGGTSNLPLFGSGPSQQSSVLVTFTGDSDNGQANNDISNRIIKKATRRNKKN